MTLHERVRAWHESEPRHLAVAFGVAGGGRVVCRWLLETVCGARDMQTEVTAAGCSAVSSALGLRAHELPPGAAPPATLPDERTIYICSAVDAPRPASVDHPELDWVDADAHITPADFDSLVESLSVPRPLAQQLAERFFPATRLLDEYCARGCPEDLVAYERTSTVFRRLRELVAAEPQLLELGRVLLLLRPPEIELSDEWPALAAAVSGTPCSVADASRILLRFPWLFELDRRDGVDVVRPRSGLATTLLGGLIPVSGSEHYALYQALRARAFNSLLSRDSSDVFVAAQLPRQAMASFSFEDLFKDALSILCSDPTALVREIERHPTLVLNRGAKAVLLCAHQLQEGATRASSLELSALRVGLTDFASAISAALPGRPWRTVWSKSQPVHANRVVLNQAAPALSFASTRSARIGVVGCSDARLWRVTPYEKATLLWDRSDTAGEVRAVGVVETADGRVIAALATSDQRVAAVDCDTGKELWSDDTAHEAPLSALAVSDDPRHPLVASSGVDGIVHVAVLADGTDIVDRARRYRHEADGRGIEIRSLAFIRAQRGWRLLFGAVDGSIGVLDPLTGALLRRWTISDGVVNSVSAHVEPDGRLLILAGASDGSVVLVEPGPADALHEDAKMHVLLTHRSSVNGVSLAQRGEQLVALAASSDRTWSMTSLDEANDGVAVEGHFGVVSSLGWLACDGVELIATVGGDGCCRVWVPEAVRRESLSLEKPTRHSGPVSAIALACRGGDELEVWTGGADGELRYWSSSVAASGRPIAREPVPISALAYHDQGAGPQQIYYGTVRGELFRVETVGGQVSARTLLGIAHDGIEALALATCAGETVLISGGRDGAATVWSTALEEPLVTSQVVRFGGVTALCVLERRAEIPLLAAAGQDGVLSFRRLEALDQLWQVRFDAPVTAVTPLPYHAAGMVVGLANGEIHFVRDVRRTSAAWQILGRHENDVTGVVAFVVGGRLVVASCGVDRSLRIWDLSTRLVLQCIELDGLALSLSSATPHIAVATTAGASVFSLNEDPILLASRPQ